MKIDRDDLETLVYKDDTDDWEFVQQTMGREWRWGLVWETVIKNRETGNYYSYDWKVSSGDGEYTSLDDESQEVSLTQVYPKQITVTYYVEGELDGN